MIRARYVLFLAAVSAASLGDRSASAMVTEGITFAVARDLFAVEPDHFHSSISGTENPELAEVGEYAPGERLEEVRGLSEFDLTGLVAGPATVAFDVLRLGGLFPEENDFPFSGQIDVVAYRGNNAEDVADYEAPALALIDTFNTASLLVGQTLEFDVTALFTAEVGLGSDAFGVRLQIADGVDPDGGAFTFNAFRLTSVPEPASVTLFLAAASLVVRRGRRVGASLPSS